MALFFELILLVASGALLFISAVLISRALWQLFSFKTTLDDDLRDAFGWALAGTIAGWLGLGITILVVIFSFEVVFTVANTIIIGLIFNVILVGICSALAARRIGQSSRADSFTQGSRDAIIAASVSLGTVGILVVYFIVNYIRKSKEKDTQKEIKEEKQEKQLLVENQLVLDAKSRRLMEKQLKQVEERQRLS